MRSYERAMRVDPVDPRQYSGVVGMGLAFIELRRFDEAIVAGKKAQRQNPSYAPAHRCIASASPISDGMLRPARRRPARLSSIPRLQYRGGSLVVGNQT